MTVTELPGPVNVIVSEVLSGASISTGSVLPGAIVCDGGAMVEPPPPLSFVDQGKSIRELWLFKVTLHRLSA